jgi:hypothetical protein
MVLPSPGVGDERPGWSDLGSCNCSDGEPAKDCRREFGSYCSCYRSGGSSRREQNAKKIEPSRAPRFSYSPTLMGLAPPYRAFVFLRGLPSRRTLRCQRRFVSQTFAFDKPGYENTELVKQVHRCTHQCHRECIRDRGKKRCCQKDE